MPVLLLRFLDGDFLKLGDLSETKCKTAQVGIPLAQCRGNAVLPILLCRHWVGDDQILCVSGRNLFEGAAVLRQTKPKIIAHVLLSNDRRHPAAAK